MFSAAAKVSALCEATAGFANACRTCSTNNPSRRYCRTVSGCKPSLPKVTAPTPRRTAHASAGTLPDAFE